MYRCSDCGSPRSPHKDERFQSFKDHKLLTIEYDSGCVMVLESRNGNWTIQKRECNFKIKKGRG